MTDIDPDNTKHIATPAGHLPPVASPVPPSTAPSESPRRDGRLSPRALIVALLAAVVTIAAVIVFLQAFVARHIPALAAAEFELAQARWQQRGPASYEMEIEIRGAQPGMVFVRVLNGEVVEMSRDGRAPRQRRTWDAWSVPGQFDMIERELEMAEDPEHEMQVAAGSETQLRAEFDPQFGYPRQFHRTMFGGGPEVYWRVSRFEAL